MRVGVEYLSDAIVHNVRVLGQEVKHLRHLFDASDLTRKMVDMGPSTPTDDTDRGRGGEGDNR